MNRARPRGPLRPAIAVIAATFALALPAHAAGESRWQGGAQLMVAVSRGSLGDVFGTGFGFEPFGVLRLDRKGTIGVRVQGGMIDYGSDTRAVPLAGAGPAFGVQIATTRNATTLALGPQLSWPLGRFRPYAYATVGAAYFHSQADLSGRDSLGAWQVLSVDVNRTVLGAGAGGGLGFRLTRQAQLDAGVEFRRYRDVRTIGDGAVELPNGRVFMTANQGDLDHVLVRVGVTISRPAGARRPPPRRGARGG